MRALACCVFTMLVVAAAPAYAQPVEETAYTAPDNLGIIVDVSSPAAFGKDAHQVSSVVKSYGAIADVLDRLRRLDDVPFALAVSPVFCEELQLVSSKDARRLVSVLRTLAATRLVLRSPYVSARLTDLRPADVARELSDGAQETADCLGRPTSRVMFAPDVLLDKTAVDAAAKADVDMTFSNLVSEPFSTNGVTIVSASMVDGVDPEADLRALSPLRTAAIVVRPETGLGGYLRRVADEPEATVRHLSALAGEPTPRDLPETSPRERPPDWTRAMRRSAFELETFRSYTARDNRLGKIFGVMAARANSTADWDGDWDVGQALHERLEVAIRAQHRHITVADGSVTFTSQRGSVPVTISNKATYPIRVDVHLSSPKRSFNFPTAPAQRDVVVAPPGDTVTFDALARSTGTFPVDVVVKSPGGRVTFDSGELTIRSTAANLSAVVLTVGGALFLIVFIGRRFRRRPANGPAA